LQGIGNASDRLAIGMRLFGEEASDAIRLLPGDIQAAADKMVLFGQSMSAVDTMQVEQANDAITSLKKILGGVFNQLAIRIAPAITDISQRLTDWATDGGGVSVKMAGALD